MNHEVTDHLKEGFQIISKDWRYVYLNDAVVVHSRFKREELIGRKMVDVYPGIEKTKMFEVLEHCMENHLSANFENEFEYPDGLKLWFELRVQPYDDGLIILSIDITSRKNNEVLRSGYVKELESLIDYTSHHIRQPVTKILGIKGYAESGELSREDLLKLCEILNKSILDLDHVTRNLTERMLEVKAKTQAVD
ncbi:MAG: PAS domain-containing protein [Bacteroidetes bacterium]|nr:PAS domain-containing protein [Bacteroidota bacterium]